MILATYTARATSPEAVREICQAFHSTLEMRQVPGWLRGQCLVSSDDPPRVFIIEEWGTLAACHAWTSSEASAALRRQVESLITGPVEIKTYEEL